MISMQCVIWPKLLIWFVGCSLCRVVLCGVMWCFSPFLIILHQSPSFLKVLLLVDASFGFEMEVFEFLNILKVHGFPKVMGILTHLDSFKDNKKLRNAKKRLKEKFWTEICDGAKLFYLSGLINGKYMKREILNLARFVAVMKFRPIVWRTNHPYVLVDRSVLCFSNASCTVFPWDFGFLFFVLHFELWWWLFNCSIWIRYEDLTNPALIHDNPNVDRTLSLYGFVRGTYLKPTQRCHLLGISHYSHVWPPDIPANLSLL